METARILWTGDLAKAFKALGYKDSEMGALQICALFDGIGLAFISMKDYPIKETAGSLKKSITPDSLLCSVAKCGRKSLRGVFKDGLIFKDGVFRTASNNPAFAHNVLKMKEKWLLVMEQPGENLSDFETCCG